MRKLKTRKIRTVTGIAIVVANMVGTGAFTSLGFQVKDLSNNFAVLTLWVLGGVVALAGAFSYAEVGTWVRKSGGEYAFLSRIYHPAIGYLAGWISITAGFAAPIALSVIAAVAYFPHGNIDTRWPAIALVALITFVHSKSIRMSSIFQNAFTLLKVLLVLLFIFTGISLGRNVGNTFVWDTSYVRQMLSPAFAVALIYVGYSYSGWNAAVYITEEFRDVNKSLPRALIGGTAIVMILYVVLQYVFLRTVPVNELAGKVNIGVIAMAKILDMRKANFFGMIVSFLLISGISAMIWVGARVTSCMAADNYLWRYFKSGKNNIPQRALWLQFLLTATLIITGTFEQIMVYCGFLLTLCSMLVVAAVLILRRNKTQEPSLHFKSPLYPVTQIFYLVVSSWIVVYALKNHPLESIFGIVNLVIGLISYFISRRLAK